MQKTNFKTHITHYKGQKNLPIASVWFSRKTLHPKSISTSPSWLNFIEFGKKLYCSTIMLDIAQAFDRIWYPGLLLQIVFFLVNKKKNSQNKNNKNQLKFGIIRLKKIFKNTSCENLFIICYTYNLKIGHVFKAPLQNWCPGRLPGLPACRSGPATNNNNWPSQVISMFYTKKIIKLLRKTFM